MTKKALVAMSGGVDSAVAALLIKEAGFDTAGATMKLWSETETVTDTYSGISTQDIDDAKKIADALGIPHYTLSLGDTFKECVINNFIAAYKNGETPNPCVVCNKHLKFGKLLDIARDMDFDYIATGHYAQIDKTESGRYVIKKAVDASKDQSYVLWSLSQDVLAHTLLPLGKYKKSEIREMAAAHGFSNAHKSDSQDICFIPDGDYVGFIKRTTGDTSPCGSFIDTNGNILGQHSGVINYTVGQRKGLGIALGKPMFVKEKDVIKNTVTLCDNDELFSTRLYAHSANFIAVDSIGTPMKVTAKIRYKHDAAPATVEQTDDGRFVLEFDTPQRAIAKGQSVVLYSDDIVVGGGIIE